MVQTKRILPSLHLSGADNYTHFNNSPNSSKISTVLNRDFRAPVYVYNRYARAPSIVSYAHLYSYLAQKCNNETNPFNF